MFPQNKIGTEVEIKVSFVLLQDISKFDNRYEGKESKRKREMWQMTLNSVKCTQNKHFGHIRLQVMYRQGVKYVSLSFHSLLNTAAADSYRPKKMLSVLSERFWRRNNFNSPQLTSNAKKLPFLWNPVPRNNQINVNG